ncbi:hypothetical protein BDCR2A_01356 [Borrelia duttonii CR2A]|uniref:Holin, BlyA family n=1 Tax=Borrelia duttonii CR2A TaxID=1432657 RepID=W6TX88_9SPIR|nr:BlyA family holin [Borrelia duttonii]ETZ17716.1 hypothetical protein BDCR2A_01356 [Borrelia duttonii CR2A]
MNDINTNNFIQLLLDIDGTKLLIISGLILSTVLLIKPALKDILHILIEKFQSKNKNKQNNNDDGGQI